MRRFIFTPNAETTSWTGQFTLTYRDDVLEQIDFSQSTLQTIQRDYLRQKVPVQLTTEKLQKLVSASKTQCIEETLSVSFEDFWIRYDKKINKKRCLPLWNKLTPAAQLKAYEGIHRYNHYLMHAPWRSKSDPENYLRNEMWTNEWK